MPDTSNRRSRVEILLLVTLLGMILAPAALTLLLSLVPSSKGGNHWLGHPWLRNATLMGQQKKAPTVPFSWGALKTTSWQESLASRFNLNFGGREALIRWTNEAYFRLFNQSASKTSLIVFGKNAWIFQRPYLVDYFIARPEKSELEPLAQNLKELQEICRGRGMGFVVLVTPSKAAVYPEEAPVSWQKRYDPRPRGCDHLMEWFREKGVICVDGAEMFQKKKAVSGSRSLFTKGGIHWSQLPALDVNNAMISVLREQGMNLQELKADRSTMSQTHRVREADVLDLANLALPWSYSYTRVRPHLVHHEGKRPPVVVGVGGSFTNEVFSALCVSHDVEKLDFYFYYKLAKVSVVDGNELPEISPAPDLDFERDVFQADCLIIEMNEQQMSEPDNRVGNFVRNALEHRPKAKG